jgi:alkylation response protein AidB-like acyl-CoA dehydrogenase
MQDNPACRGTKNVPADSGAAGRYVFSMADSAQVIQIYEGTNQIQRTVIGRQLLK